jgi:tetratricopeptide (TPR) repeat protein
MNKKSIILATLAILTAALCATPAWAQMASVRGKVNDEQGKPIADATVTWVGTSTGHRYPLKTDKKGQYFSIGVAAGTYDVVVTSKDGKEIPGASAKGFNVSSAKEENVLDFDLQKAQAAAAGTMSAEEKAKREAALKENTKVKSLNDMLAAARAASQAGNYDEAVRVMKDATAADPNRDLLWAQLGDAYLGAGKHATDKATATTDFEQAAEALQKALAIKPSGAYHNNLGEAYAKSGKTQEAIQEYQAAAQAEPTEAAKYYFNLGAVLTNTGHPDEANDAFDKVIAADPAYSEAYYQKAVNLMGKASVDEKTGEMKVPPEVATNLNKYLELAPNGPNAQPAKDLLASLGAKIETNFGTAPTKASKKK